MLDNVAMEFQAPRLRTFRASEADESRPAGTGAKIVASRGRFVMQALSNISFSLTGGDSLALIGHNGAGKTTLLRVLAGVYLPPQGRIEVHGEIANGLNVNLGFRNEATGRRNIELKGLLAGYPRDRISELVQNVREFADLGAYIDAPLRTYSAGMRARLAFGIATAFPADILLLDEWLGAGDRTMRQKAHARMRDMVGSSSILVMASQLPALLRENCKLGLVLHHGEQMFFGPLHEALVFHTKLERQKP